MEEGEKEFTYLQDELGSTIRLLEQGVESQAVYGVMMSLEKILITHRDRYSHSAIQVIDMIM